MNTDDLAPVLARLDRIEATLQTLVERQTVKEYYTTEEVAAILGKSEYTVREWCRQRRMVAKKLPHGRGNEGEWRVSHAELDRYRRDGLLPLRGA